MKQIDIGEFTSRPDRYLHGSDAVRVRQDGRTIGYYLPAPPTSPDERQRAVAEWGRVVLE